MKTMDVRSADGYRLSCRVSGDGDRILLGLHGGPGGDGCAYLDELHLLAGPGRTVVTFDQLGTGASEAPAEPYAWSVERAVADVEAVRAHFGAERVDVYGHSWGGMLALQYSLDLPERVRRLVLANTSASAARVTASFLRQLLDLLPPYEAIAALTADMLLEHHDGQFRQAVTRWLGAYDNEETAVETTAEALNLGPAGAGLWGERLWFATAALRGWDVEGRLGELAVPTLIVNGEHDMSDRAVNEVMAEGIADAEWITLNGRGHLMLDEVGRAVVESFLNGWRTP